MIVDDTLSQLIASLRPSERAALVKHMRGKTTPQSWEIVRRIRASLKRKARAKLPRKLAWLE